MKVWFLLCAEMFPKTQLVRLRKLVPLMLRVELGLERVAFETRKAFEALDRFPINWLISSRLRADDEAEAVGEADLALVVKV